MNLKITSGIKWGWSCIVKNIIKNVHKMSYYKIEMLQIALVWVL